MTDNESPVLPSFEFHGDSAVFWDAFAKAQGAFQPVLKTKTVTVYPKQRADGSHPKPYTFDYAPLDEVLSKTLPALNSNGFSLIQPLAGQPKELRTMLMHASGGLECILTLPNAPDIQQLGSSITYLRRYSVSCLLGIASEEDDDGNVADGNTVEQKQDRTRPPPVKPAQRPGGGVSQAAAPSAAQLQDVKPIGGYVGTTEKSAPDVGDPAGQGTAYTEPPPGEKRDTEPAGVLLMTEATKLAVTRLAVELGFNKVRMGQFCMKVIGRTIAKDDESGTEDEGQKLLKELEALKVSADP